MTDDVKLLPMPGHLKFMPSQQGIESYARACVEHHAAALEAARKDAERYRWLRSLDGSCDAAACVKINTGFDWIVQHGADLDAHIDAAREDRNE